MITPFNSAHAAQMWVENSARLRRCVAPCVRQLSGGECKTLDDRWCPLCRAMHNGRTETVKRRHSVMGQHVIPSSEYPALSQSCRLALRVNSAIAARNKRSTRATELVIITLA